jgi:GNAT superfamily N-acetyltransferase
MIEYRETNDIDLEQLERLTRTAGWDRGRDTLARQIEGARWVVSAWDGPRLVGFARAISDGVTNAYVSTVVVDPELRGRGIGRQLIVRLMQDREHVAFVLHARPAVQDFYIKCGFSPAENMMRRPRREG